MEQHVQVAGAVQGRITESLLPEAEKSFPGITAMYAELQEKPKTFLQLVWIYEGRTQSAELDTPPRRGRRNKN